MIQITIHPVEGGDSAGVFVALLEQMYIRYAERMGWVVRSTRLRVNGASGITVLTIQAPLAYTRLRYEQGLHRSQRLTTDRKRVRTAKAWVGVTRMTEPLSGEEERPPEIESGGGGREHSKIVRTYSLCEGRVNDHRLSRVFTEMPILAEGDLDTLLDALRERFHDGEADQA